MASSRASAITPSSLAKTLCCCFPAARRNRWAASAPAGGFALLTTISTTSARECYLVSRVIGELQNGAKVASPYNSGSFTVNGVEPLYSKIRTIPIAQGRFLADPDETDAERVAVLGDNVRKQLFGERNDGARAIADLPEWPALPHRRPDARQEPEQQLQRTGRR